MPVATETTKGKERKIRISENWMGGKRYTNVWTEVSCWYFTMLLFVFGL